MSRNAKVGIGVVVAVVAACLCLCLCAGLALAVMAPALANQVMETDPGVAQAMGHAMLDYDLPAGYHELAAMNILTVKMVMIGPAESAQALENSQVDTMIVIAQVASKNLMDDPQVRAQMQRSVEQGFRNSIPGVDTDWEEVDSSPMTIAGQEVMVRTYEATGVNGEALRQLLTDVFDGKNGATFIMVLGEQETWPKDAIEAFLGSIR